MLVILTNKIIFEALDFRSERENAMPKVDFGTFFHFSEHYVTYGHFPNAFLLRHHHNHVDGDEL